MASTECWPESSVKLRKRLPSLDDLLDSVKRLEGIRVNFIANGNSQFVGASGSSRDLSTPEDRAMLIRLRSVSDVIVTDAATARREAYKPSKWAEIEVWSESGNFQGVDPQLKQKQISNLEASVDFLSTSKLAVLLETGPTLTRKIAQLEAIDQLRLTVVGVANQVEAELTSITVRRTLGLEYLGDTSVTELSGNYFFTIER